VRARPRGATLTSTPEAQTSHPVRTPSGEWLSRSLRWPVQHRREPHEVGPGERSAQII
jgi:hypothetical protein